MVHAWFLRGEVGGGEREEENNQERRLVSVVCGWWWGGGEGLLESVVVAHASFEIIGSSMIKA